MGYPTSREERARFWLGQLSHSQNMLRPHIEASQVLVDQYFNDPTTEREKMASSSGAGLDEHVRRTKSGIIFGWIDQSLANMVDRDPIFQVFPETKEAAVKIDPEDSSSLSMAQGAGKIVNYRYRDTNQRDVDEAVARDAFLYPYGVAKIGYNLDYDTRFQDIVSIDEELLEFDTPEEENLFFSTGSSIRVTVEQDHIDHIDAHTLFMQTAAATFPPDTFDLVESAVQDHIKVHQTYLNRKEPEANVNVKIESPFAVRWLPEMFLTDQLSLDGPRDARWCAFGWQLPIEEVKAKPEYERTSKIEPSRLRDTPEKPADMDSDGFDVVNGWEVWAKNWPVGPNKFQDLVFTVVEDHPDFIQYEEEWPYDRIDDYPCEVLVYQSGVKSWYNKAPLLMAGGDTVQSLLNEVLDSYLSVVRKQKNIWLVDSAAGFEPSLVEDILDAPDGSIIEVPGLSEAKGSPIMALPFHSVPNEKTDIVAILQQMFDRGAGTPQPVQLPKTDTATEANILEKRNTARENRRSNLLSQFQTRKARKMFQLDTQFKPERSFLIDRNAEKFLELTPEMAEGEYLFSMDITSHSTALSVERSQWMDLLNLFAGLTPIMMQTFGLPPNLPEVARRLLVRGFEEKVVEEILPMLDQAASQMQAGGAVGPGPQVPGGVPPVEEGASPTAAQGAQEAKLNGQSVGQGVGPLQPDSVNRDIPNDGKQSGNSVAGGNR